MIHVQNVHKTYQTRHGKSHVLNDVSFDLRKGEKLGILGRNGAGKSTLVRLVSGAEQPTSGLVERSMSVSWPLAFGGAFQADLTGKDNVRFISRIYRQDFDRNLEFVEQFAELGSYLLEPVRTYSSGMRARLAFAISMIIEFDCFLIDEVGAVGDARFHEKCNYELFTKRADRAMVMISHDATYVRDHCNRFGILHDGKLGLYDDFDVAYSEYAKLISVSTTAYATSKFVANRSSPMEVQYQAALADEQFMFHVRRGDWAMEKSAWSEAEDEYSAALKLHPYERTYWSQHGHAVRAQGKYTLAEISYRNSCALGYPLPEISPFIKDAMAHQSVTELEYPIRSYNKGFLSTQPPVSNDVLIFAKAFWGQLDVTDLDLLDLIRNSPTLDSLAERMLVDEKCIWRPGGAPSALEKMSRAITGDDLSWIRTFCQLGGAGLKFANTADLIERFQSQQDLFAATIKENWFSEWSNTSSTLSEFTAAYSDLKHELSNVYP